MIRIIPSCLVALGILSSCGDNASTLHGYAEGEFVMMAPETAGRIAVMSVTEGTDVPAGAPLFRLDTAAEQLALDAAKARAAAAVARFEDALAGGRAPEVAVAREQFQQARAVQVRAGAERERAQQLFETGAIARARLDEATSAADAANARVAEARQRVALTELPARENQIKALAAENEVADAQVALAEDALRRKVVVAPAAGRVERILRFAGDVAGPTQPAVRFLPEGHVIAILFIPQPLLARVRPGTRLTVGCDGCPDDTVAEVVSVADETEFTPPIIYSDAERARLVYRAKAKLTAFIPPPGTPIRAEVARDR